MRLVKLYIGICYVVSLFLFTCTEPFALVTESFEDLLVVEATITDEFKYQEIKVSRTYLLEDSVPVLETNADVRIEDSNKNTYRFIHTGDGLYRSVQQFQALVGVSYKLIIDTDGKEYVSTEELLAGKAEIENLYAELVNLNGTIGVQVLVDTNENLGTANFFRYEYEETYKIVAPSFVAFDVVISNVEPGIKSYDVDYVRRPEELKVCYSSNYSTEIILTNTNGLAENRVSKFPVRFIPSNNSMLRDRYSILVKQYVQSADANNFYKILKDLGTEDGVFIGSQPGYIQGNISSKQDSKEKVIGFFDVSSVTSKRIYFNYSDFNIELPPYFYDCDLVYLDYKKDGPPPDTEPNERYFLYQFLVYNNYKYFAGDKDSVFIIVRPECGDCTTFSSNIKPSFWED
ncbi:DUF4249 domain-containing protein [Mariniflexile sp. HMF6888]|uniref:DUF4249 domain-containing protein n=1 Tax=Mariniflexile sp. HMF6888 TaxID=3373086 RepID=UPI0037B40C09